MLAKHKTKFWYLLLISFLLGTPTLILAVSVFSNSVLAHFWSVRANFQIQAINSITQWNNIASKTSFIVLIAFALFFYLVLLLSIASIIFVAYNEEKFVKINNFFDANRISYLFIVLIFFFLISTILSGIAQYNFAWFNLWISAFSLNTKNINENQLPQILKTELLNLLSMSNTTNFYGWIALFWIWPFIWLCVIIFIFLLNRFNINIHLDHDQQFKLHKILRFKDVKHIILILLGSCVLLLIVPIAFAFLAGIKGLNLTYFITLSYVRPYLFHDPDQAQFYQVLGENHFSTLFTLQSLLYFGLVFNLGLIAVFLWVILHKKNISFVLLNFYLWASTVFIVMIAVLLITITITINQQLALWNQSLKSQIKYYFNTDTINLQWVKNSQIISAMLLEIMISIVISTLCFKKLQTILITQIKNKVINSTVNKSKINKIKIIKN